MECPRCHYANAGGARFCGECGASLTRDVTCSSCGHANPAGQTFCNGCGGRLDESARSAARDRRAYTPKHLVEKILASRTALEGERKQVTVLFADVKGSMDLAEQVDPELYCRQHCRKCCHLALAEGAAGTTGVFPSGFTHRKKDQGGSSVPEGNDRPPEASRRARGPCRDIVGREPMSALRTLSTRTP